MGKFEFGRKGADGIKGEGIDESAQGELYEKNGEIKSEGEEIKKLLDSIENDDRQSDEEASDFRSELAKQTNDSEKSAEEYKKDIEEAEKEMEQLENDIAGRREEVEKIFG